MGDTTRSLIMANQKTDRTRPSRRGGAGSNSPTTDSKPGWTFA